MDGTINFNSDSAILRTHYVCIPDNPRTQNEANKKQTPVQNVKNVFVRNGNLISISIESGQHSSPPNEARICTSSNQKNCSRNIDKNNSMLALPSNNFQQHSNLVFVNVDNQAKELIEQFIGTTSNITNEENLENKSEKAIANITDNSWKVSMDQHPHSMIVEVPDQKEYSTVIDLTGDDDQPTELKKQFIETASNKINLGNKTKKGIRKLTDDSWKVSLDQHLHSTSAKVQGHIEDLTIINLASNDNIIKETQKTSSKIINTEILNEILLTEEDLLREKYYNDMRDIIEKDVIPEVNIDYLLNDINVDEIVEALKECYTLQNRKEATPEFVNFSSTILSPSTTINLESSQSQMVTHSPNVNNPNENTSADSSKKVNKIINLIKYDEHTAFVSSINKAQVKANQSFHTGANATTDFSILYSASSELNPSNCDVDVFTSANQQLTSQVTKSLKSGDGTTSVENSKLVNHCDIKNLLKCGPKIIAAPSSYSDNNSNNKSRNYGDKRPVSDGERSQSVKVKNNQNETSSNDFDIKNLLSSGKKIAASGTLNTVKVIKSLKSVEGTTASGATSQVKKALDCNEKIMDAPSSYPVNNENDKSRNNDKRSVSGGGKSQPVKGKTNELFKTAAEVPTFVENSQSINNFNIKNPLSRRGKITAPANLNTVQVTKLLKTDEGANSSGASSKAKKALDSDEKIMTAPNSYSVVSGGERSQPVKKNTNELFKTAEKVTTIVKNSQSVNVLNIKNPLSSPVNIKGSENFNAIKVNKSFQISQSLVVPPLKSIKKFTEATHSYSVSDPRNQLTRREKEFTASNAHTVNNKELENGQKCNATAGSYSIRDPRNQLMNSKKTFTASDKSSQSAMGTASASPLKDNANEKNKCIEKPEAIIANSQTLINQIKKPLNTDIQSMAAVESSYSIILKKQYNNDGESKDNNLHNNNSFINNKKIIGDASNVDINLKLQSVSNDTPVLQLIQKVTYEDTTKSLPESKGNKNSIIQHKADLYAKALNTKNIQKPENLDRNSEKFETKVSEINNDILIPLKCSISNLTSHEPAGMNKNYCETKKNKIKPVKIEQTIKHENSISKKSRNRSSFAALNNIGPTHSFGAIINSNLALKNYVIPRIRKDLGINKLNNAENAKIITFECKSKDAKMLPIPHATPQNITSAKRNDKVVKTRQSQCDINTSNFNEQMQNGNEPKNTYFPNKAKLTNNQEEKCRFLIPNSETHGTTQNITKAKHSKIYDTILKTQSSQCESNTSNINGHLQKVNELKNSQCPNTPKLHNKQTQKCQFSLPNAETTINIKIYNMNLDQPCLDRNDEVNKAQSEEYCELSLINQEVNKFNLHKQTSFIRNKEKHNDTNPSKITVDIKKRKLMGVLDKNETQYHKNYMKKMKSEHHHALDDSTESEQLSFASNDKIRKGECRNNIGKTNTKKRSHRQSEIENKLCEKKNVSVNNIDMKQTKKLRTIENESNIVINNKSLSVNLAEKLALNRKRENVPTLATLNVKHYKKDCELSTKNSSLGKDITTKDTKPPKLPTAGRQFDGINNPNRSSSNENNELIKNKQAENVADNSIAVKKLCVRDNYKRDNGASTEKIIEKEKYIRNNSTMFVVNTAKESKMLCNLESEYTNVSNIGSLVQGIEKDKFTKNKEANKAAYTPKVTMTNVKLCTVDNGTIVQDASTIQGNEKKQLLKKQQDIIEADPSKERRKFEKLGITEAELEAVLNKAKVGQENEKNTNKQVEANTALTSSPINVCNIDDIPKKPHENDQPLNYQPYFVTKEIKQPENPRNSDSQSQTVQYETFVIQEKIKNKNYFVTKDKTENGTLTSKLCISDNVVTNETLADQENEKGKCIINEESDIATNTVKHTTPPKNSDTLDNQSIIAYNGLSKSQVFEKDKIIRYNQDTVAVKNLCTTANALEMCNDDKWRIQEKDKFFTKQYYNNRDVTPPEDKPKNIIPKLCEEQAIEISVPINKSMNSVKDDSAFKSIAKQEANVANCNDDKSKHQVDQKFVFINKETKPSNCGPKDNHHTENKATLSASLHSSLLERYRIDTSAFVHKGEHSRIIKARTKKDNSTVAVKILPKMSLQSTHIEILRKICDSDKNRLFSCIGIEEIYDAHRCWCISMTFYPLNLSRALEINGTGFNIDKVQDLSRQLLAALILLRTNEIFHTDIKPSHILINTELTALKLTGFDKAMYNKGVLALPQMGTFNYHAPEVFLGISFGYPGDIWSAACTMFEMATKQILFGGVFPYVVLENITSLKGAFSDQLLRKGIHRDRYFSKKAKNYESPKSSVRIKLFDAYKSSIRNVDQIVKERKKILMFSELLDGMLALDYNERKSIELAYIHPFVYK